MSNIHWFAIGDAPEVLRDGRPVLLWMKGYIVGTCKGDDWIDGAGGVIKSPTAVAELNPPGAAPKAVAIPILEMTNDD